jgi:hypothetical protein
LVPTHEGWAASVGMSLVRHAAPSLARSPVNPARDTNRRWSMITLSGTFKARESCDRTTSMITLSGTFKVRESCDQTKRMITLGGTFKRVNHAIEQRA